MLDVCVGKRIMELRKVHNYTREVFAEKIDISAKFLYEIEIGRKGFSANTLKKISLALSVSCDYIIFGKQINQYTSEKIKDMLATMTPVQLCQIQKILQILYEICDTNITNY